MLTAYRDFPFIKMSKKEVKLIHYLSNRAREHFSLLAVRGNAMFPILLSPVSMGRVPYS